MSDNGAPVNLDKMTGAELEQFIEINATADAESAVATMLEGIRAQQIQARAALDSAAPQMLDQARELVQQAKEAADWLTMNASTFENVHRTAFIRGAVWMLQQIPQRGE